MGSIRWFLIILLVAAVTLGNFSAAVRGYIGSMQIAEDFFDERLEAQVEFIHASLGLALKHSAAQYPLQIAPTIVLNRPLPSRYHIEFQVFHPQFGLIARSEDFPVEALVSWQEGFTEFNYHNIHWRGRIHWDEALGLWYLVAERLDQRYSVAESVIGRAVLPLIIVIPLLIIAIWWIVTSALSPLQKLTQSLSIRNARDFSSLPGIRAPRELIPLIAAINGLLERLAKAFAREQRFSADAAHELRTPLAALKVHAANLTHSLHGEATIAQQLALRVQASADRMGHLIEQILTLNRTSEASFSEQLFPQDLLVISRQVFADFYAEAEQKQQSLEILSEGEYWVMGEPGALTILFGNLLSNAIKYTPKQGQIRLHLQRHAETIDWILDDSGPGIPAHLHERVYDRFYRVGGDRHQSNELGCGLGLSIASQIVNLHGGTIHMETSYLNGLSVQVQFPLNLSAQKALG